MNVFDESWVVGMRSGAKSGRQSRPKVSERGPIGSRTLTEESSSEVKSITSIAVALDRLSQKSSLEEVADRTTCPNMGGNCLVD